MGRYGQSTNFSFTHARNALFVTLNYLFRKNKDIYQEKGPKFSNHLSYNFGDYLAIPVRLLIEIWTGCLCLEMRRISFRFHHQDDPRNVLQDDRLKKGASLQRRKKKKHIHKKIQKKCRFLVSINQLGKSVHKRSFVLGRNVNVTKFYLVLRSFPTYIFSLPWWSSPKIKVLS